MNLRCMYCQTMFGVSRDVMLIGLQTMEAEKLTHYDIYCPKCRRANRVERRKLELANPNWQATLKAKAKETEKAEKSADGKEAKQPPKSKPAPKKTSSKPKAAASRKTPAKKSPAKAKGK